MIRLEITTSQGEKVIRMVSEALQPRTILAVVGGRLMSYIDESFRTAGRGDWQPLAQSTLALRRRGGSQPLQDTGRYKQSWVQESDSQTYVEVGTNLKTPEGVSLGMIHEFGTRPYAIRAKRAKVLAAQPRVGGWFFFGKEVHHPGIPARPVMPSHSVAERIITATLDAMLERIAHNAGRGG